MEQCLDTWKLIQFQPKFLYHFLIKEFQLFELCSGTTVDKCFTFYGFRHVHITEATLYKLNNEYHVEPYLTDPFQTYLILPSEVRLCYEII